MHFCECSTLNQTFSIDLPHFGKAAVRVESSGPQVSERGGGGSQSVQGENTTDEETDPQVSTTPILPVILPAAPQ